MQTEDKLNQSGQIGETKAMSTHFEVGREIRQTIERIGGRMPEALPREPSIKHLLDERRRSKKRLKAKAEKEKSSDTKQDKLL